MKATIYRPSKSSMQSGLKNAKKWVLKIEGQEKYIEPFMGWTGSIGAQQSSLLNFETKEEAENFAKSKQLDYEIIEPKKKKITPKSYIDNFNGI